MKPPSFYTGYRSACLIILLLRSYMTSRVPCKRRNLVLYGRVMYVLGMQSILIKYLVKK